MTAALMAAARAAFHLDRPCPACGAAFSLPCRTRTGNYRPQVHRERLRPLSWTQDELFGNEQDAA